MADFIHIKGARLHNLKGIDVSIPLGMVTVVTGVSGCGKSSLVVDILGKLSRQRYMDVLDYSGLGAKPLLLKENEYVDLVEPVSPPVILSGHASKTTKRSTVATVTGLGRLLKNLIRFLGEITCPACGQIIDAKSIEEIVAEIQERVSGENVALMAPLSRSTLSSKEKIGTFLSKLIRSGYLRIECNGKLYMLDEDFEELTSCIKNNPDEVFLVIDRLKVTEGKGQRLFESVRMALHQGNDRICCGIYRRGEKVKRLFYSTRLWCQRCRSFFTAPEDYGLGRQEGDVAKVTLMGEDLNSLFHMDLGALLSFIDKRLNCANPSDSPASTPITKRLIGILQSIKALSLEYLSLSRPVTTLSSGEFLKLRLAAVLAQRLTGVLYILDEPVSFLPHDEREEVCRLIQKLKESGNTVVIIEHAQEAFEIADYFIEMGPGAGKAGGRIVSQGWIKELDTKPLVTVIPKDIEKIFSNSRDIIACQVSDFFKPQSVSVLAKAINLVSGPTGSGKSRLLVELKNGLQGQFREGAGVFYVAQEPVFRSKYSIPATVLSVFGHIRALFSRTKEARGYGLTANMFSLAKKGGRCDLCKGTGQVEKEGFGYEIRYLCPVCKGARFNKDVLSVRYKGLNISQVLDLTCSEAADFFSSISAIRQPLEIAERVGVGYVRLGQPLPSLSSGEAQRLKIASHLIGMRKKGASLFLLDQPTAGLHPKDVVDLADFLKELLEFGSTVVMAENNPDMLKLATWLIRLEGKGPKGGNIVFDGPIK